VRRDVVLVHLDDASSDRVTDDDRERQHRPGNQVHGGT